MTDKVVTRFAPSPTGYPHLGTAMYALLNYLYAKQKGGKVIMRSEDTDPVRSKREYEGIITEDLAWLGIKADEFVRQSERLETHKNYIQKMIVSGHAYVSPEQAIEGGPMRDVVRFKNPNKTITFNDIARGEISVDSTDLRDFIIARDIDSPLFHLTVVTDDFDMGVTHVIRGEDGLANTPRQILIQEAIGASRPVYAHYPFVLGPNRQKMGKRNGAVGIREYKEQGYLPEAVLNFCLLLVWHHKDDRELFTLPEMIEHFELERIAKSGAILDQVKLDWFNREYMKKLSQEELIKKARPFLPNADAEKFLPLLLLRINKFGDIPEMLASGGEFDFLCNPPQTSKEMLVGKSDANIEEVKTHLTYILEKGIDRDTVWPYAEKVGKGKVLWPMRVALSGKEKSPDPLTLAHYLGKEESISRLKSAIQVLS